MYKRQIVDCAKVLDSLKDEENGYYDPRDPFTTIPRSSVLDTSYVEHVGQSGNKGSLEGTRIGVIRESFVYDPVSISEEPIVTAANTELKEVLHSHLGATLVESVDPLWEQDDELETMKTDYRKALCKLVPVFMPDILFRLDAKGEPLYKEFAASIVPTEFAPGVVCLLYTSPSPRD